MTNSLKDDVLAVFHEHQGEKISVSLMQSLVTVRIAIRHPRLVGFLGRWCVRPSLSEVHNAMHALKRNHHVHSYVNVRGDRWVCY